MSESPILEYWPEGIAAARIPANNNVRLIQALLLNPAISATTAAQPSSPAEGDVYILPASPTGSMWASFFESDVVIFYSATWTAYEPAEGLRKFVDDEGQDWQFVGDSSGGWAPAGGGGGGSVISVQAGTGIDVDSSDAANPEVSLDSASIASLALADTSLQSVVAGTGISINNADPQNPIITATGGGGGSVAGSYAPGIVHRNASTYFFNDGGGAAAGFANPAADRVYYYPFTVGQEMTAYDVGMIITSGTSGKVRIGIRANDNSGGEDAPGSLLQESADLSTTATPTFDPFTATLSPGVVYWIQAVANTSSSQMRAVDMDNYGAPFLGRSGASVISYLYEDIAPGWSVLPTPGALTVGVGNNYVCAAFTF